MQTERQFYRHMLRRPDSVRADVGNLRVQSRQRLTNGVSMPRNLAANLDTPSLFGLPSRLTTSSRSTQNSIARSNRDRGQPCG